MNMVHGSREETGLLMKNEGGNNRIAGSPETGFEYEGYRVSVFFNGNKTLTQCIKNLAERRKME